MSKETEQQQEQKRLAEAFPEKPQNLSQAINTATRDLHDIVNHLIVQRFMLGLRDYRLYREGILSFYHVYSAFERTWAHLLANASLVKPHIYTALQALSDPRLTRAPAIALDLTYLYDAQRFDPDAPADANSVRGECVAHIEKVLLEKPHLLLAYAHNYYMALFAGGKMLLRQILMAKDFFPVKAPAGDSDEAKAFSTNMFVFPVETGKEESLRAKFKAAMELAEENLSEEEKTEIIQESRHIYQMNERLVRELDEICGSLAIPAAQLDRANETLSFVAQYKLLLILVAVTTLSVLRYYL
ncbi:hypothetical protein BZA05DRAFT_180107 [Tricharina praecox]|uniref:uncharacterized protein n=1 Tax=Tricharina praecox TaxID=43433 RepID=UPI00221F25AC|nr:uncharacterized protein BZA05DRAFT_180107 [Tricharina praecox]KAI5843729.1 hypothetical protein BZA05DRAFT_180107 [Tricharina praecox]